MLFVCGIETDDQHKITFKHWSQCKHCFWAPVVGLEEYSLGLVSRYSTVRSGTLTWREWGLWFLPKHDNFYCSVCYQWHGPIGIYFHWLISLRAHNGPAHEDPHNVLTWQVCFIRLYMSATQAGLLQVTGFSHELLSHNTAMAEESCWINISYI